jgi:hypothetical protein
MTNNKEPKKQLCRIHSAIFPAFREAIFPTMRRSSQLGEWNPDLAANGLIPSSELLPHYVLFAE